jgi:hypothetical protein
MRRLYIILFSADHVDRHVIFGPYDFIETRFCTSIHMGRTIHWIRSSSNPQTETVKGERTVIHRLKIEAQQVRYNGDTFSCWSIYCEPESTLQLSHLKFQPRLANK